MPPFDRDRYNALRTASSVGVTVHYRDRTGSTMDDARAGAAVGQRACGDAYVAAEQQAGRGRMGRSWVSAASAGLYVTYHLCPQQSEHAPLLAVAGGLAAADAIRETSGLETELKWPNDVLHAGRKLCGVLAEARPALVGQRLDVFLGIGINVRATPQMPPGVAAIATSIEQAGVAPPPLEALLAALSGAVERWAALAASDPSALIAAWRPRLATLGRRVQLRAPGGVVEGEAVDVNAAGELVLRRDDGSTASYAAGDVTTLSPVVG